MNRSFAFLFLLSSALIAQDPPAAAPQQPATQALPAAGSPEAQAIVDKAIDKMLAYGKGSFKTTQSEDNAMMRGAGVPFGQDDTEVEGGWSRNLRWGSFDGSDFLLANGRMLAKVGGAWKLRGKKLGDGKPAPFTLDPELFFTVLKDLPAESRKVVHVDAAEVAGKACTVLSLQFDGEAGTELAESGALPGGGGGGFMMMGGGGGFPMPEIEHTVYVALFVDAGGDVVRLSTRSFEDNPMFANVQIQVAGGPGGGGDDDGDEDKEQEKDADAAKGAPQWKKGLPVKKPGKTESVTTFRADFKSLGLADAPPLDDRMKAMLRAQ
ncbi:MAG: hypothetical protein JNK15_20725 [Planctomycetes bacterium]|nr:hypothetical protein [Planctomycetota bacterium]